VTAARARSWRSTLSGYAPELAIGLAAILYGSTFRVTQVSIERTNPAALNTMRYAVGAAVILPFALRGGWRGPRVRRTDTLRIFIVISVAVGLITAAGTMAQTIGLRHTTVSNSAFITGLFAVFTPIIEAVIYRRWPRRGIVEAVAVSMVGLYLLTGASFSLHFGDLMTLAAALFYAGWYVVVGAFANRFNTVAFVATQLAVISIVCLPFAVVDGFGEIDSYVLWTVIYTGVGCSAIAFSLSAWAQRRVDPSRTTIISLVEPVVAGVIGYFVGERLGIPGYLGAVLILGAIVIAERGTHRGASVAETSSGV
jgi:drug/metabolite transporter (DMT)-like permease